MEYNYHLNIDSLLYNRETDEVIIKTTDRERQINIKIPIKSLEAIMNVIEMKKKKKHDEKEDEI